MLKDAFERWADREDAKEEFARQEARIALPNSHSATFIQVLGILGIIGSILLLSEGIVVAVMGAIGSAFILAMGRLHQAVVDIRNILLKTDASQLGQNDVNA